MTAPSRQSRLFARVLRQLRVKERMSWQEMQRERLEAGPVGPPSGFQECYAVTQSSVCGRPLWRIAPTSNASGKHIIYLHGGAYVANLDIRHWKHCATLVAQTGCTVHVPDYPLAPEATAETVFAMLMPIYLALLAEVGPENIVLCGDSAGGGMAVALVMQLLAQVKPLPRQLLLYSPWLDVRLQHPGIDAIDANDPFLNRAGLQEIGRAYADDLGTDHYLVSPVIGNVVGLPPIAMFVGTHDIFLPDCRAFTKRLSDHDQDVQLHEYPEMVHTFMLSDLPESAGVLAEVVDLLRKG